MSREGRKRLAVDISENMHKQLKKLAHERYCTVTHYVIRAILEKIKRENGDKELFKVLE